MSDESVSASYARENLKSLIRRASQGERIFITKHGKIVAAVVSISDLKILEARKP